MLTQDLYKSSQEEVQVEHMRRPMAAERKYYTQISGKLLKSRKKLGLNTTIAGDRAFKSAEAYNKLLAFKHANKIQAANAESSSNSSAPTNKLRHPTPKVSFNCKTPEQSKSDEAGKNSSEHPTSTAHVTSVKVSKRVG